MADWASGYVTGIDYTYDFYRELTPQRLSFAALCVGQLIDLTAPGTRYCELGCGFGFSANLLAASNPDIDFHAMDFNPAHIAEARRLANDAALPNVHFYEKSFADFAGERALPDDFDVIALHGVYSWVSAENRHTIVDFISRKLRPGGLVYVSYNTMPGWAAAIPLRRIISDRVARSFGAINPRLDDALDFAKVLVEADAGYFRQNASVGRRLTQMVPMSRNYLAHEYMTRDWTPFYFEDVVSELSGAKLSFVGSADPLDCIDDIALTKQQQTILASEPDLLRRQTLRDFMVNQQFRADLFVKGPLHHAESSTAMAWVDQRFVLSHPREQVPAAVKGRMNDFPLVAEIFDPILDAFVDGPLSVRELLGQPGVGTLSWGKVTQAITVLVGAGYLFPAVEERDNKQANSRSTAFNDVLCRRAKESDALQFLSSPVTGGGVRVDRFEQIFLLARSEGMNRPEEWADLAWKILKPRGFRLTKDQVVLESDEDNLTELFARAHAFAEKRLPLFETLRISV